MNSNTKDAFVAMSEGNPGAMSVLMGMLTTSGEEAFMKSIADLKAMDIRGPRIWVAYKYHFGEDLAAFVEGINKRDPAILATIKKMYS